MKEKEDDVDDADYLIDDPNYPRQLLLLISEIKVPDAEWRAPLNEETVQQLMSSIASVGLIEPVQIDLDCVLRIGRHRFEAIRRLGWKYIPVTIFEGLSEDEWRLRAVDENLERNQSTVYQRCLWIRERKILYERLYPPNATGSGRGTG
jgi:ParB-like chromosome segregation protein Spo0J